MQSNETTDEAAPGELTRQCRTRPLNWESSSMVAWGRRGAGQRQGQRPRLKANEFQDHGAFCMPAGLSGLGIFLFFEFGDSIDPRRLRIA